MYIIFPSDGHNLTSIFCPLWRQGGICVLCLAPSQRADSKNHTGAKGLMLRVGKLSVHGCGCPDFGPPTLELEFHILPILAARGVSEHFMMHRFCNFAMSLLANDSFACPILLCWKLMPTRVFAMHLFLAEAMFALLAAMVEVFPLAALRGECQA